MCLTDRWAALQFDQAVTLFGLLIENASQERINVGGEDKPRWEPRYTLTELLTDGFLLEPPTGEEDALPMGGVDGLTYDEVGS
jgi:hypothetical protein